MDDMTWNALVVGMNGLSKRFKAVAQNIANVNTPGYARSEVTFENELREALNMKDDEKLALTTTDDAHISNVPRDVASITPQGTSGDRRADQMGRKRCRPGYRDVEACSSSNDLHGPGQLDVQTHRVL